jgi:hypothetical protein
MTRDEFDKMLEANQIVFVGEAAWRVAQLVAAAEREACAQVCSDIANKPSNIILGVAITCADAIRARGQE